MSIISTKHTTKNYTLILNALGNAELYSYNTYIATLDCGGCVLYLSKYFEYSATTKRHLHWFFNDIIDTYVSLNDIRTAIKTNKPLLINGYHFTVDTQTYYNRK